MNHAAHARSLQKPPSCTSDPALRKFHLAPSPHGLSESRSWYLTGAKFTQSCVEVPVAKSLAKDSWRLARAISSLLQGCASGWDETIKASLRPDSAAYCKHLFARKHENCHTIYPTLLDFRHFGKYPGRRVPSKRCDYCLLAAGFSSMSCGSESSVKKCDTGPGVWFLGSRLLLRKTREATGLVRF